MDAKPYVHKILKPDGTMVDCSPAGEYFTLEELRAAMDGGWVENINLSGGFVMIIDEEGRLKELPRNNLATELVGVPGVYIVGNALVCLDKGEELG
ncbi:hypothetical protein LCGC14_1157620 [marine sediment metagenome]|uniref:DUF3846 domain-containing protein n=1 Tax=marine sediment metagenome TaxID=412755 RepID=A0A0F9MGP2_9ZZZZ